MWLSGFYRHVILEQYMYIYNIGCDVRWARVADSLDWAEDVHGVPKQKQFHALISNYGRCNVGSRFS